MSYGPAVNEIVELRRYTLHPGQRDVLIELFDREFVETQEATGMRVLGQFRDLGDPDQFVWVRGFPDMATRRAALTAFYTGPAWRANSAAANATMIDVDNVLLLRPAGRDGAFRLDPAVRDIPASSLVVARIYALAEPAGDALVELFANTGTGGTPLGLLRTEYAENDYPALPVRTGVHRLVSFTSYPDRDTYVAAPEPADLPAPSEHLLLSPTYRSLLR